MIDSNSAWLGLTWILIALVFCSFLWAGLWYFRQDRAPNPRKRIYKLSIYACLGLHAAAMLMNPWPARWMQSGGVFVSVLVLILFWSAVAAHRGNRPKFAFDEPHAERIVQTGPYRFVRHPFYASFMLACVAGTLVSGRWELLLTIPCLAFFYFRAAHDEESYFLAGEFSESYREYCSKTGRFFPRLRHPSKN